MLVLRTCEQLAECAENREYARLAAARLLGKAYGGLADLAVDADAALGNVAGALHEAPSGYRSPRRSAGAVARKCEGRPVLRGGLCKNGNRWPPGLDGPPPIG